MGSPSNTVWDHLAAFFRGGLDRILADLNRTISRLDAHVAYHNKQGAEHLRTVDALKASAQNVSAAADAAFAAANKTASIRDRLSALVA